MLEQFFFCFLGLKKVDMNIEGRKCAVRVCVCVCALERERVTRFC